MADYRVIDAEQLDADLTAVAEAIRGQSGGTEPLAFPEGLISGVQAAGDKRFADGEKAYQDSGRRTNYGHAFAGSGWNSETFHPKYDIIPTGNASGMFQNSAISGDLVELMNGKKLDFSKVTSTTSLFNSATEITRIGEVDCSSATTSVAPFDWCWNLVTVDKLVSNKISGGFTACGALKNITIEGTVSSNLDMHWSTLLSKASITSVINALSTTSGLTLSLSQAAVDSAFSAEEWDALLAARANWTISLV